MIRTLQVSFVRRHKYIAQSGVFIFSHLDTQNVYYSHNKYHQRKREEDDIGKASHHPEFKKIPGTSIYTASAYLDLRKSTRNIVIMGIAKKSALHRPYYCFHGDSKLPFAEAEIEERKDQCITTCKWFFVYIKCSLEYLEVRAPRHVYLMHVHDRKKYYSKEMYLHVIHSQGFRRETPNMAICVQSLFDMTRKDSSRIIEFMELQKLLGVSHVYINGIGNSKGLDDVLNYYMNEGSLTEEAWTLPEGLYSENTDCRDKRNEYVGEKAKLLYSQPCVKRNAQLLVYNDCLYRHMDEYSYLLFADIDEYIIPTMPISTLELMSNLAQENKKTHLPIAEYSFQEAEFKPDELCAKA